MNMHSHLHAWDYMPGDYYIITWASTCTVTYSPHPATLICAHHLVFKKASTHTVIHSFPCMQTGFPSYHTSIFMTVRNIVQLKTTCVFSGKAC